jgi:hypothetical protein
VTNGSRESVSLGDAVMAKMNNVDDVGLVLVWNGRGIRTVARCDYVEGKHGSATRSLDSTVLCKGPNYVVFVVYNKVFSGVFAGGKWSYDCELEINKTSICNTSDHVRSNASGIMYWKVFRIDVADNGRVRIDENVAKSIPKRDWDVLEHYVDDLEEKLLKNADVGNPR